MLFSKSAWIAEAISVQGLTAAFAGFLWFKARKAEEQQQEAIDEMLELVMSESDNARCVHETTLEQIVKATDSVLEGMEERIQRNQAETQELRSMLKDLAEAISSQSTSMMELAQIEETQNQTLEKIEERLAFVEKRENQQGDALTVAMNAVAALKDDLGAVIRQQRAADEEFKAFTAAVERSFGRLGEELGNHEGRLTALEDEQTRPDPAPEFRDPWQPEDPVAMAERLLRMSQNAQGAWQQAAEDRRREAEQAFSQPMEVQ